MNTCYCLLHIDPTTRAVIRAGLYSAPTITTIATAEVTALLLECKGETFALALIKMRRVLASPPYAWVQPLLPVGDRRAPTEGA